MADFHEFLASPASSFDYETDFGCKEAQNLTEMFGTEDLRGFVSELEWLHPSTWHYAYSVYGCSVSGRVASEGRRYVFRLDAGGAGTLQLADTYVYFGHPSMAWDPSIDCLP